MKALLNAINIQRTRRRLPPLTDHTILVNVANRYANVLFQHDKLSHSLGGMPWERAARAGYRGQLVGENIAWGYPDVESVVAAWMSSPGHRANILGNYKHFGGGMAGEPNTGPGSFRPPPKLFWCTLFGA